MEGALGPSYVPTVFYLVLAVILGFVLAELWRSWQAAQARRAVRQDLDEREAIAARAVGGSPDRPFVVTSPAVIDLRAANQPCPLCGGKLRLDHQAVDKQDDGELLRVTHLRCQECGVRRRFWFRLDLGAPN